MRRIPWTIVAFVVALALPAAAQEGRAQDAAATGPRAALRVLHLAPEGPDVDVRLDGRDAFAGLGGGDASGYLVVPPGEHSLEVYRAGAAPAEGGRADDNGAAPAGDALEPLARHTVTLEAGRYYTLIATAAPAADAAAEGAAEEAGAPAEERGSLSVRVEPAEATVNVTGPGGYRQSFTGPNELSGLVPGDYAVSATGEGYETSETTVTVEAGETEEASLTLEPLAGDAAETAEPAEPAQPEAEGTAEEEDAAEGAQIEGDPTGGDEAEGDRTEGAGTGDADTGTADTEAARTDDARSDDAAAAGDGARAGLTLRMIEDALELPRAGRALLRVVHAAPDAPAVVVVAAPAAAAEAGDAGATAETAEARGVAPAVRGDTLAEGLAFGEASDYVSVEGGPLHLQVQTEDGRVLLDLPGTLLTPGAAYTFYAYGAPGEAGLLVALSVDAGIVTEER